MAATGGSATVQATCSEMRPLVEVKAARRRGGVWQRERRRGASQASLVCVACFDKLRGPNGLAWGRGSPCCCTRLTHRADTLRRLVPACPRLSQPRSTQGLSCGPRIL